MEPFDQDRHPEEDSSVATLVQGNTAFALDLYHQLQSVEGNLFFSPYSISTALAMTYAGAQGETAAQMAQALHFPLEPGQLHPPFALLDRQLDAITTRGDVKLQIADALWVQTGHPFLKSFLTVTRRYYGARIIAVDYTNAEVARQTINGWVEKKTAQKIKDLIPAGVLDALTRLVLTNAIYFKGNWASQFDPSLTAEAPFWVASDEQVQPDSDQEQRPQPEQHG